MFVEKLSLFGFKSFNQRVSLEFDAGISSIIGPNGCGKSNIVDAIRWVLGEQSTKQLRGAKMEDVIFNGTRHEKPLSMAEVELTLNNDQGRLAIDYSTVSVARRLYRSGISEYLINKKPVRLKDVRNLFMDTGMGSHAYSVIERQMVDNILSDTTGHRRFLFEEAAGIMKYKTRKKEALTKLEATERDLLRVHDIISEVDRQVNSLKRQVGKASRYRELMAEIRDLDLAHSRIRRQAWRESLRSLESRYREALQGAESGETEVAGLEARLEEIHLAVLKEERSLAEARESLAQVDDELGQNDRRILVLRERLQSTRTRIEEAGEYKVRLTDRQERNAQLQEEVAERLVGLETRETDEKVLLEAREAALVEAEAAVRTQRDLVQTRKQEAARHRDDHIRAEGEVALIARRLEDMEERLATQSGRKTELEAETRDLREALDVSRRNVETARKRVQDLEEEIRVLEAARANHVARVELLRKTLAEKREQEAATRSRLDTLEDLAARYEGFDAGVRALMLEENRDAGVRGTLGELVRIPGEWRTPLEPALSRIWQHLVVDDTRAARRLVQRLREESLGFATLVPLDRVPETPARTGDLTWAIDVLEYEAEVGPLLAYLLDGLALVQDLDAALKVVREGQAARAVTRTGQFVDAAVIAGGTGGSEGTELMERDEALERCRKNLESLSVKIAELGTHEDELTTESRRLETERERLVAALDEAVSARNALEKEESGLGLRLKHVEDGLETLEAERRELETERDGRRAEQARLEVVLQETRALAGTASAGLTEGETALAAAEAEREQVVTAVHDRRMEWARLEGELRDARGTLDRLRNERQELDGEWDRTVQDESDARQRVVEIEGDLEELAHKIQELNGERDRRAEVVAGREREKAEAVAREQQDSEALREVRRRATDARQIAHRAELELAEIRGNLKHLEERLHDEYEIEPAELDRLEPRELPENVGEILADMKDKIRRLGPVNLLAVEEYEEKSQRLEFMTTQRDDLVRAKDSLVKTIGEINKTASGMFLETFTQVQENFQKTFQILFQGGECSLTLTGDDPLEADIDVTARPRGKKPQGIAQLSSGERALTAIALLFAIYLVKPSPFCILDEVDAPLDDANIDRFVTMVKEFSNRTQFIVITHNKLTMEAADRLYGVTMQQPGVSSVVSVKLDGDRSGGNGEGTGATAETAAPEDGPVSPESVIAQ